jgi:hypothetical protein
VHEAGQLHSLLDLGLDHAGRKAHFQALFDGVTPPASPRGSR